MKRSREYRRSVAETHIARKKWISKHIYGWSWYKNDNQYSKNKVYCSCNMCRGYFLYLERLDLKSLQNETDSQCEESDLELKLRIPNGIDHFRSNRHSHGWK